MSMSKALRGLKDHAMINATARAKGGAIMSLGYGNSVIGLHQTWSQVCVGAKAFLLMTCLCLASLIASPAKADVQLPEGYYFETTTDLKVKVLGGFVSLDRTWYQGEWHFNRLWNDLEFTFESIDGGINSISRNDDRFARLGPSSQSFTKKNSPRIITFTGTYTWKDREGNVVEYNAEGKLTAYKNRNNVQVSFTYDANGKRIGVFDHLGNQVLWYEYTGNLLTAIRDANLRRVQYSYTGNDLTQVIDVLGNAWNYTYTGDKLTTKTDAESRVTTMTYSPIGRVASIKDPEGNETSYVQDYDSVRKEFYTRQTTASGRVLESWFDTESYLIRQDINGQTVLTMTKQTNGRFKVAVGADANVQINSKRSFISTDKRGNATRRDYDEFKNLTKITHADGTSVSYEYEHTFSNVTKKTNENGVMTDYTYDANGNLTRLTEATGTPDERITENSYDQHGQLLQSKRLVDANTPDAVTAYTYDNFGNTLTKTDPRLNVTTYTYDIMGNVLTENNRRGFTTTNTYDDAGRRLTTIDPLLHTWTYSYDRVGNHISETDPLTQTTTYEYDGRDNIKRIVNPDASVRQFQYNALDQLVLVTDEAGHNIEYRYAPNGRLTHIIDGVGNETRYEYDDTAQIEAGDFYYPHRIVFPTFQRLLRFDNRQRLFLDTALINDGQEGLVYRYAFDGAGNVISETDPEGKTQFFDFTALDEPWRFTNVLGDTVETLINDAGDVYSLKDENGNLTSFIYDANDRLIQLTKPGGQITSFAYDAQDNLTEVIDANGRRQSHGYDDAGRQIHSRFYDSAVATIPVMEFIYSWNARDDLIGWSANGVSSTLSYDTLGRFTGETLNYGPFSLSYSYTYYANGLKATFTGPDSITYTFVYDNADRLTGVQVPGEGIISVNEFQWRAPSRITLPGGTQQQYTFTDLLELQTLKVQDPAANIISQLQLQYDQMRNVQLKDTDQGNYTYAYDDLDRLQQAAHTSRGTENFVFDPAHNRTTASADWLYNGNNQLSSRPGVSYEHDANGNQTRKVEGSSDTRYLYDHLDRLVRVEDAQGIAIAEYGYDPFDRRLWKQVGAARTFYLYSDEGLVGEYDASGNQLKSYLFHPDGQWTTHPILLKDATQYAYYHNDQIGTPHSLTNRSGALVWNAVYDAFGKATVGASATLENNLRFPGQYLDAETGLHYNFRRYYDPDTGRYLTPDPIGYEGGINLYSYVQGNPITRIDPTGECGFVGVGAGAAASAGIAKLTDTCFEYGFWDAAMDFVCLGALSKLNKLRKLKNKMKKPKPPCNSFPAETLVHTKAGLKPIADIKEGDQVLSHAEWTGKDAYQAVDAIITGEKEYTLVKLALDNGETLEATDGHPVFVYQKGWMDARLLKKGQRVLLQGKGWIRIQKTTTENRTERVYNLTVANSHTFYVGKDGVLVHNAKKCHGAGRSFKKYGHARSEHGAQRPAQQLKDRARGTGDPQGHFSDNRLIEEAFGKAPKTPGAHNVTVSSQSPVYHPNGSTTYTNNVTVVYRPNGTPQTAYPSMP